MDRQSDPNPADSVTQLIDRLRSGSADSRDQAARRLWDRYLPDLLKLARQRVGAEAGAHMRDQIGALHPVLGPGGVDIEDGDAQIAITGQGQIDRRAKLWIEENRAPGEAGRGLDRRCGLALAGVGEDVWRRQAGPVIGGLERDRKSVV